MLKTLVAGDILEYQIKTNSKGYKFCQRVYTSEKKMYKYLNFLKQSLQGRWAWQSMPWSGEGFYLIYLDDEKDIVTFSLTCPQQ